MILRLPVIFFIIENDIKYIIRFILRSIYQIITKLLVLNKEFLIPKLIYLLVVAIFFNRKIRLYTNL